MQCPTFKGDSMKSIYAICLVLIALAFGFSAQDAMAQGRPTPVVQDANKQMLYNAVVAQTRTCADNLIITEIKAHEGRGIPLPSKAQTVKSIESFCGPFLVGQLPRLTGETQEASEALVPVIAYQEIHLLM
jgi:hypothetical protein